MVRWRLGLCLLLLVGGCVIASARIPVSGPSPEPAAAPAREPAAQPTVVASTAIPTLAAATPSPTPALPPLPAGVAPRPAWLGTRPLPLREDGHGQALPTPPELVDRRLPTVDLLPPPADGGWHAEVLAVTPRIGARATWRPDCPVALEDLAYLRMSFWGFDDRAHTGEMIVHATVAHDVVGVFRQLFEARFPIEEMRLVSADELEAPPTGDGNDTAAFVCREARSSGSWSQHAYGLAVDVNPFHNPYLRGDLVLPELASAYLDRNTIRPGMIVPGDVVTTAFSAIGWGWGGHWSSLVDPMHFSANGR